MKLTTRETVLFGILGGATFGLKACMMMLPNIEPVTLMTILFALTFGKKAIYPIYVYVALELLFYGMTVGQALTAFGLKLVLSLPAGALAYALVRIIHRRFTEETT